MVVRFNRPALVSVGDFIIHPVRASTEPGTGYSNICRAVKSLATEVWVLYSCFTGPSDVLANGGSTGDRNTLRLLKKMDRLSSPRILYIPT
jgi:hypothetical protein